MDTSDYVKRYLSPGEYAQCKICGRVCTTVMVDPDEYKYKKESARPQQSSNIPPRIVPKENGDDSNREAVFINKYDDKDILCKFCFLKQYRRETGNIAPPKSK